MRNYYIAKNVNFEDHPQSAAKNNRLVTVIPEDHRVLIAKGVKIVDGVNASPSEGAQEIHDVGEFECGRHSMLLV